MRPAGGSRPLRRRGHVWLIDSSSLPWEERDRQLGGDNSPPGGWIDPRSAAGRGPHLGLGEDGQTGGGHSLSAPWGSRGRGSVRCSSTLGDEGRGLVRHSSLLSRNEEGLIHGTSPQQGGGGRPSAGSPLTTWTNRFCFPLKNGHVLQQEQKTLEQSLEQSLNNEGHKD